MNPHQVQAALFAFKSPLSSGVILADEVGLGKTIEAGLVLTQYWSERRRKIQREIFDIEEEIEEQRDELIDELKKVKEQTVTTHELFTIQWEIL